MVLTQRAFPPSPGRAIAERTTTTTTTSTVGESVTAAAAAAAASSNGKMSGASTTIYAKATAAMKENRGGNGSFSFLRQNCNKDSDNNNIAHPPNNSRFGQASKNARCNDTTTTTTTGHAGSSTAAMASNTTTTTSNKYDAGSRGANNKSQEDDDEDDDDDDENDRRQDEGAEASPSMMRMDVEKEQERQRQQQRQQQQQQRGEDAETAQAATGAGPTSVSTDDQNASILMSASVLTVEGGGTEVLIEQQSQGGACTVNPKAANDEAIIQEGVQEAEEGKNGCGDEPEDEDDFEATWNEVVSKIEQEPHDSLSYQDLKAYQAAAIVRDTSKKRLESVYQEGFARLSSLVDHAINDIAGNVVETEHGDGGDDENNGNNFNRGPRGDDTCTASSAPYSFAAQKQQVQQLEAEIVTAMTNNDERRKRFLEALTKNKSQFEHTHAMLLSLVLHDEEKFMTLHRQPKLQYTGADDDDDDEEEDDESGSGDANSTKMKKKSKNRHVRFRDGDGSATYNDGGEGWGCMFGDFAPTRANLELFQEARLMYQNADERFQTALADIEQNLRECLEQLEIVTADAYDIVAEVLDGQSDDIRSDLASNLERRQAFERNVQEQALQSQSFFAQLLSSVQNFQR